MSRTYTIEPAQEADCATLIAILAQDSLGGHEDIWNAQTEARYRAAMAQILTNPNDFLRLARAQATERVHATEGVQAGGGVLGFVHMSIFHTLPDQGARIATLHSVFVGEQARGQGVGAALVRDAEMLAKTQGASFVTLTSNKKRLDAHRFYRALGYEQRHEGFKKKL